MRLNINLATKPYLDVRRVVMRWGGLVLLLALCTVGLIWKAASNWHQGREINAKIARVNAEIAELDRQHDETLRMLKQPENVPVLNTSKFLNGLIARKSFSWTRVFMQLEQIMPPKLHVVSISPELEPATNTVQVHLAVAGTSRDAAIELVKRLEQSPSFREARIVEEREATADKENTGDTVQFHLTAVYVPQQPPQATLVKTSDASQPGSPAEAPAAASAAAHTTPGENTKVTKSTGGAR